MVAAKRGAVVIVTGASSGIGRALALRLGLLGLSRRPDRPPARSARSGGRRDRRGRRTGRCRPSPMFPIARNCARPSPKSKGSLGPADVMVANAGFGVPTRLDPLNTVDVEQTIRVNLLGVIYSIEAVLPGMIARKSGHLLGISSLGAFKGMPGESAYCASKAAVNAYMEGLRIALRSKGVVVTTVCPGFVDTPMTPMDSAKPFLMSADAAAQSHRSLDRDTTRRRGSLSAPHVALDVAHRSVARRTRRAAHSGRVRPRAGRGGGVSPMIDLALKMLLDEKVRFAATVLGVGFAAALIMIQMGLFFGLLENASITIERLDADLWVTARNTPNVDFGNPFPETYVQRVRSVPGVAASRQPDRLVRDRGLPTGAKESVIYYGLKDFPAWNFPWNVESGDPADLRRGQLCDARCVRRAPVRAVSRGRLPRVSGTPSQDHRPDPRSALVHDEPCRLPRLWARPIPLAR